MSLAITHFAVGGILSTIVLIYLLPPTRYARSLVLFGGIWGMIPDIHWVVPTFTTQLRALHQSEFANIFWLHKTLDVIDPESKIVATLALGTFLLVTLIADRCAYTAREQAEGTSESVIGMLRSVTVLGRIAGAVGIATGALYLLIAIYHPGLGSLLGVYFGVGTILVISGVFGLTAEITIGRSSQRLATMFFLFVRIVIGVGGITTGIALLAFPLRVGLNSFSVAYAGLGSALLLHVLLFAQIWVEADTPRGTMRPRRSE